MPNPGDLINGRYQIIHELGEGGFGTTYLAKDTELPNAPYCVIKHLQPRFHSPTLFQNAKERFAKEGHSLERLGCHPQIPQLFAYIEENQEFYLIQEFIDGEEIRREVGRGVFDEHKAVNFLKDGLEVLSFVHQQGVIHRDLKPSNLLRRRSDHKIVLIDFGAVKEIETMTYQEGESPALHTQAIGTPGYMSPEQQYGKPVFSSDIYGLGRTAIFALTGRSPIELEDTQTGDLKHWQQSVNISQKLKDILAKMTNPRLSERYDSAYDVLQDLEPLTQVGQLIGDRYKIKEFLGGQKGHYTYLAENMVRPDQSPRIIHQLTPPLDDTEANSRILQKLNVLEQLGNHERIPQLLDHLEQSGNFYLVQEYIEGQSLHQVLKRRTCLSESQVIHLLKDVLPTLDFIHQHRVIHRDIKPSNLIAQTDSQEEESERYFVIDFGVVKEMMNPPVDRFPNHSLTKNVGSAGYISPEQLAGRPIVSSDLYGLGMTAIQALIGQHPKQLKRHPKTGEILWPTEINFHPKLIHILEKMTHLDLKKRYQNSSEVLKDLEKVKLKANYFPIPLSSHFSVFSLIGVGALLFMGLFFYGLKLNQTAFLLRKGDLELDSGNYQAAIQYYNNALEESPIFASKILKVERALIQQARAYSALQKPEKMLETCEEAINLYPQSAYAWNCKGTALHELGKLEQAIQAFALAIELNPELFEAWHNRGVLYAELNERKKAKSDFKQAESDLKKAIDIDPNSSYVSWNDLGKLYYHSEDYPSAIAAYQEAVKIQADYLPSWIGLGKTYSRLKNYQAAIAAYERAIEIAPNSDEAWYSKGLALEALEDYEKAYESYDQARVINPKNEAYRKAQQRVRDLTFHGNF